MAVSSLTSITKSAALGARLQSTHEPGVPLHDERRVESGGESARHVGGADVPRNVTFEIGARHTECAQASGKRTPRVLAGQEERRSCGRANDFHRGRIAGAEEALPAAVPAACHCIHRWAPIPGLLLAPGTHNVANAAGITDCMELPTIR